MGFFDNVKKFFGVKQEAQSETTPTNQWLGHGYDFRPWETANVNAAGVVSSNQDIFDVVTQLSNTLASLPIHKYKKYEENDDSLANLVRVQPNPTMSGFELIRTTEASRNVAGNGYIWIQRDPVTMTPLQLWPIDPGSVTVERNDEDDSIWYRVDDMEGHHFLVPSSDMIHVKHISALASIIGISPIEVLTGTLRFQHEIEDFSMSEMQKKDMFILKYDRSINPKAREAMIKDFRRMAREQGGAIVQEAGWTVDHFSSDFKPTDLSTIEGITRKRIANAFNVPVSFLNDGTAKNTVNVEHVMTQFVVTTLVPIVRQYESELNRKLLTSNQLSRGQYFKFNVNGLMRGDTAARTQFYQTLIRNGIATQNELRKLEDLPPLKEKSADMTWISKDLYPAENQMKASEASSQNQQSNNVNSSPESSSQQDQNQDNPTKGGEASGRNESGQNQGQDQGQPGNQTGS